MIRSIDQVQYSFLLDDEEEEEEDDDV